MKPKRDKKVFLSHLYLGGAEAPKSQRQKTPTSAKCPGVTRSVSSPLAKQPEQIRSWLLPPEGAVTPLRSLAGPGILPYGLFLLKRRVFFFVSQQAVS